MGGSTTSSLVLSSLLIFLVFVSYYLGFKVLSGDSLKYQTYFSGVNSLASVKTKSIKAHLCVYDSAPVPAISPSDPFPFSGPLASLEDFRLTRSRGGADLTPATGAAFSLHMFRRVGVGHFCISLRPTSPMVVSSLPPAQVRSFAPLFTRSFPQIELFASTIPDA